MKLQLVIFICIVSILSTEAETDKELECYQCVLGGSVKSCDVVDKKQLKKCHDEPDARNKLCTEVTTYTQVLERGCRSITELQSMKEYVLGKDNSGGCNPIGNETLKFYCACHTIACNDKKSPAAGRKSTADRNPTTFNQVIVPVTLLSFSMWQ